jgi:hypothetical protein
MDDFWERIRFIPEKKARLPEILIPTSYAAARRRETKILPGSGQFWWYSYC